MNPKGDGSTERRQTEKRRKQNAVQSEIHHAQCVAAPYMNIYAHALESADKKAADALETMLRKQA